MAYDYINPSHYAGSDGKQTYQVIEEILSPRGAAYGYLKDAIKYLERKGKKEGQPEQRDVNKALWYINRIKELRAEKKIILHETGIEFLKKLEESCFVGSDVSWIREWDRGAIYIY